MISNILIYYSMFTMQFPCSFWHKWKHYCQVYDSELGINCYDPTEVNESVIHTVNKVRILPVSVTRL